jgi:transposase
MSKVSFPRGRGSIAQRYGQNFYEMQKEGVSLIDIARAYQVSKASVANGLAWYRKQNGAPVIGNVEQRRKDRRATAKGGAISVETHGAVFHKMHCGKGLTAAAIARREEIPVETVRMVLQAYREQMWGEV